MKRKYYTFIPLYLLSALLCSVQVNAQSKELDKMAENARKAVKKGLYQQADSIFVQYVALFRQGTYDKDFDYSEILGWMAQRAAQKGQISQAIELQNEVIDIRRKSSDCTFAQLAAATSDLASFYSQKADYNKAIEIGEHAVEMLRKEYGFKHNFCCIAMANLASFYAARAQEDDYTKAVILCEQAVGHMKKGTPEYATALNALIIYYTQTGNRTKANKLSKTAIKVARKTLKKDMASGAAILNNNAIRLANVGNYEQAIEYMKTAIGFCQDLGRTNTLAYGKMLTNLSTFCTHLHRFKEAAENLEQALPIIENATNKNHPDYVRCLSDLANVYKEMGNLERANDLAHQSDMISQTMGQRDSKKYAKSLSKQAATFASNGNYTRAIEHERKALEIYANRKDSLDMASSMGNLAYYLFSYGKKDQALNQTEQALNIFRRCNEHTEAFAQALNNSAILYYNAENYGQATTYGRQAQQIYSQRGDTASVIYARILANNALFSFVSDSMQQAVLTAQRALKLHQEVLGNEHFDNVPLLYNLSVYLMKDGQLELANDYYHQALILQSTQVRTNFLHLTSQERENFWNQKSYVFRFAPMLAYLNNGQNNPNSVMATDAYNSILFTKGILLNSEIDFKNLLKRTGDVQLLKKYNELELLRNNERDFYKLPVKKRNQFELKRLREDAYQLERALVKGCKEYGNFTENLNISANQVKAALSPDEVAIEFADIYLNGVGKTYIALLLRHDSSQPQFIRLFSEEDLKDLKYGTMNFQQALRSTDGLNQIYTDSRFGLRLWQPIMKHLDGVKKIYFSPTSMFYQIGIEYLPCDSLHRITDFFDVFRLSSTKQLVHRQQPCKVKTATIYGGLNYDMDLAQLKEQHDKVSSGNIDLEKILRDDSVFYASNLRTLDSLSLRGSVNYLPGTEHEVFNIAEQLLQNDVDAHVLIKEEGTEESFKALSGSNRSVIHIATHGFSFSESEIKKKGQQLLFLNEESDNQENALNYSGLLLSGANYVLNGNKLPKDIEDGILTAREISLVDLGKVDMVVLSACQTALGEIREDGVFGIQRGFKKAGAGSLLMSLWKVDDEATKQMMIAFYKYMMEGLSAHKAFNIAQQYMRQNGYPQPYFWASFILLDGLD